ncbi:uncharacterized protein Z519_09289 [Cladophialophora bantiana CBS 173.52]|uniref:RBR-type E3 ubiquitin transferase n=1 Tax=Cladophialophora bantiana (strain ATCC 10958 / CBS 173.52 / CDC B-1940 / NIH 8579) TaxID=1442370 RepID=A0A0D2HGC5_CLAB1|nr:uncharacterized protein Z519_09289 [Cladophialophora bantiana CBS 173.52]KIW89860.1 hypothetical protein Z519_09289 [Cladophialophora bantiana CBS 173.52]
MEKKEENEMVCDTFTIMHYPIENQPNNTIHNLPRNGKGVSNTTDGANEQEVLSRIKSRVALIESSSGDRQLASALSQGSNIHPAAQLVDYEPYINPFTGQQFIPNCLDEPGPSYPTKRVPCTLIASRLHAIEHKHKASSGIPRYAEPPVFVNSAKHRNLHSPQGLLHTRSKDPTSEVAPCDTLSEAFGGSPLPSENTAYAPNACTNVSMSLNPSSARSHLDLPCPAGNPRQAYEDNQGIEPSLQESEEELALRGWNREWKNHVAATKGKHHTGLKAMPDGLRADLPDSKQQHQCEVDRSCTMKLTGDVPQDHQMLLKAETSRLSEERKEMQVDQDETDRRDQEEMKATFEQIHKYQDGWNREVDLIVRQEHGTARQVAAREERREEGQAPEEMRRFQSQMQTEDDRMFETNQKLARAFSEIENEAGLPPDKQGHPLPTWTEQSLYPETPCPSTWPEREGNAQDQSWGVNPFRWLKKTLRLALSLLPAPVPADISHQGQGIKAPDGSDSTGRAGETSGKCRLPTTDREQPRQEEQMRKQLANVAECSVCADLAPKDQMCRFGCKHYYCRHCLETAVQTAVKDRRVFKCCRKQAEPSVVCRWLPAQVHSAYTAVVEELTTPNPTYCHSRRCSAFIPPVQYVGDTALCSQCSTETCRLCKQKVHPGVVCEQDSGGQALLRLSKTRKWMQCPNCKNMVERSAGCLHMICRCGSEFCYNCGKSSWRCRGDKCARG